MTIPVLELEPTTFGYRLRNAVDLGAPSTGEGVRDDTALERLAVLAQSA
jgi:hypothetical protein